MVVSRQMASAPPVSKPLLAHSADGTRRFENTCNPPSIKSLIRTNRRPVVLAAVAAGKKGGDGEGEEDQGCRFGGGEGRQLVTGNW